MSFYRIEDPAKRNQLVKDYIATAKRLRDRSLNERLGQLNHESESFNTFNPILQANEKSTTAITNELVPIKQEIQELNKQITEERNGIIHGRKRKRPSSEISLLDGDHSRKDMYFGIQKNANGMLLGNKQVFIENDQIKINNISYPATIGLISLIMDITPTNYTKEDIANYKRIILETDLINNPSGIDARSKPKQTNKYRNFLLPIVKETIEKQQVHDGSGIQFLPNNLNELFEKLALLTAEFRAGNTTTRNEIVAILDLLRKRSCITESEYTNFNTLLSAT